MKIIFSANEIVASLKLSETSISEFKFLSRSKAYEISKTLHELLDSIEQINKEGLSTRSIKAVTDFNKKVAESNDTFVSSMFQFNSQGQLEFIMDWDSVKVTEILELLNEEVGTFVGIAVTIFGLMKTFGSSLKKLGRRIDAIAKR